MRWVVQGWELLVWCSVYNELQLEWGCIRCDIFICMINFYATYVIVVMKEACLIVQSSSYFFQAQSEGLKLIVDWSSGFPVDWNPIRMKNQILSRYRMHIGLSYESGSEWGPWRAWAESLLHYIKWWCDVCVMMNTLAWFCVCHCDVSEMWIHDIDVHFWLYESI